MKRDDNSRLIEELVKAHEEGDTEKEDMLIDIFLETKRSNGKRYSKGLEDGAICLAIGTTLATIGFKLYNRI